MIYKEYGKTGKKLSVVGNGGTKRFNKDVSIEENAEILLYSFGQGINHFDTAEFYNHTNCEYIYGHAIKQLKRDTFYSASKTCSGPPGNCDTKEKVRATIQASLERMNLDKFDFYYVWQIKTMGEYEETMRPGGVMEGLMDLKSEGLIGHILFSAHMQGDEIIPILNTGHFEGVLLNMNILNFPYTLMAAKRAKELGMGAGVMSPLAGGLIPQHEDRLGIHIKDGETLTESAVRFITHLPWVDFAYFGMRSREQTDSVCKFAEGKYLLTDAEIADIQRKIGDGLTDACTSCMYCMDVCPKNVPVASYMQLYNMVYVFNEPEEKFKNSLNFSRDWMSLACRKADAKDCIRCGKCETACTQKINIMERLHRIAEYESTF